MNRNNKPEKLQRPKVLYIVYYSVCVYIYIYSEKYSCLNAYYIVIYTWNPNDPCFDWKGPCFGGLTFKNRGHLGCRYIYELLVRTKILVWGKCHQQKWVVPYRLSGFCMFEASISKAETCSLHCGMI